MEKDKIIIGVAKRIKSNEFRNQIESYLKSNNIAEEDRPKYYEDAKQLILDEKLTKLPLRNKVIFGVFVSLTLLFTVLMFDVIPNLGLYSMSKILVICGSAMILVFSAISFGFYKSWTPKRIENDKSLGLIIGFGFMIFIIPIIILGFFIMNRFDTIKVEELRDNAVLAIGFINSGQSVTVKGFDFTELNIKFKTKQGEIIRVEHDVSRYEFRDYIEGQKVLLEYSSKYPENIKLIMNQIEIIEKFGSHERMPDISDLIIMLNADRNRNKLVKRLDNIIFGWYYNKDESAFVNMKYDLKFNKYKKEVVLKSSQTAMKDVPRQLEELGFVRKKDKSVFNASGWQYESESYYAIFGSKRGSIHSENPYNALIKQYFVRIKRK